MNVPTGERVRTTEHVPTREQWRDWLGMRPDPDAQTGVGTVSGHVTELTVTSWGTTLECRWQRPTGRQLGTVLVPFYSVETVFGQPTADRPRPTTNAVADRFLERGLAVVAVPWWAEVEAIATNMPRDSLVAKYDTPARRFLARNAGTSLGRALAELELAVEAWRGAGGTGPLGVMGHSLGGKLALWFGALNSDVAAVIAHEMGLGWEASNWFDPWYLSDADGEPLTPPAGMDALLDLIAPRPFLYGGGGGQGAGLAYDGPGNEATVARSLDRVGNKPRWLDIIRHNNGHAMPRHVVAAMADWSVSRLIRAASDRPD
ncbi:hypothetical protein ACQBAU_00340 [Propionibacteriaceae bacterium Y2011]